MNALYRLEKIEGKLLPKVQKIHFIAWADCKWNQCEGLVRQSNESKEKFFKRIRLNKPDKLIYWCK